MHDLEAVGLRFILRIQSRKLNVLFAFQEAWVVERMGKFFRVLQPGLNLLIPVIDRVKYVQSLKELAIDIPQQSAITSDNVTLNIDGVLYLKVSSSMISIFREVENIRRRRSEAPRSRLNFETRWLR